MNGSTPFSAATSASARRLVRRCEPDVKAVQVGRGYHNAGWAYIEVEIMAVSISKAFEEAARLDAEVMEEFSS
jgi:hypothetical protein